MGEGAKGEGYIKDQACYRFIKWLFSDRRLFFHSTRLTRTFYILLTAPIDDNTLHQSLFEGMSQINDQGYTIIDLSSPGSKRTIISPPRLNGPPGPQHTRPKKEAQRTPKRSSVRYKAVSGDVHFDMDPRGSPGKANQKKRGQVFPPVIRTAPLPMYPTGSPVLFPPRTSNGTTIFSPPPHPLRSSQILQVPSPPSVSTSNHLSLPRGSITSLNSLPSRAAISPRLPGMPPTRREARIKARNYMFIVILVIVILLLILLYYLNRHIFSR
ncbi:hypothetical protein QKT48_gp68 [Macropodid alphaherpesvirus 4]|uniref:Uncharacterized protein n=1 Tax=Macropodid alphaherpesvirus 4 TaxID=2762721 RepID=A0A7L7YUC7_9ALPH|nr:hypothetical protein QKT48_gp68 [Macropodid alphaherpesvirus 4]QOD40169.1 hypothetical protein [Macropodid alphaherpesvirus 4]